MGKIITSESTIYWAEVMIKTRGTVRSVAKNFGASKSTVHKHLTENLKKIDYKSYRRVKAILNKNKKEAPLRGGMTTKAKYEKKKMGKN